MLGVLTPIIATICCAASVAAAQEQQTPTEGQKPPPYKTLRYAEDYSFLKDPARHTDVWDPLKYIALNDSGDWHLSLGGEARERFEYYNNYRWNPNAADEDGYLLQRYLIHADLHMGESVRVFGQLQTSLEDWRAGGPRPTDENRTDLHQLFADFRFSLGNGDDSLTIRLGRQEMAYGSQRLISIRESPNIRRAFDAARVLTRVGEWSIDAFIARPVEDDRGSFDDSGDGQTNFWGLYATGPTPIPGAKIDLYYLGLRRPDAEFVDGIANELRHSIGSRLFGTAGDWDYNFEGVIQWGRFGGRDILAWTIGSDTGYTFRDVLFTPRAGVRADVISGDQGSGGHLGTFNALYPKGAYFGEIALIGPANLIDLHPTLDLQLTDNLKLSMDWDVFWRYSTGDGIYDNGGNVIRGPGDGGRFIGHQASIGIEWELGRHTTFNATYSHFFAGDYLRHSGPHADVDFVGVWITYRF